MAPNKVETLLFDLDGTLYGIENGYEEHVRQNVFAFMHEKLGVEKSKCKEVWRTGFQKHNQTLKGLRSQGFEIDKEEFWDFIRSGREQFLSSSPEVAAMLSDVPMDMWVLTNCNEKHAALALEEMGIDRYFKGVLGSDFMEPNAKPQEQAFQAALDHIGAVASSTMIFEDSVKNIRTCKEHCITHSHPELAPYINDRLVFNSQMGMMTVLVAGETAKEEGANSEKLQRDGVVDYVIANCSKAEIERVMPWLLKSIQVA